MAGFGSSTIFLPLALLFVDFKTAIILVAIFHLFGNLSRIIFFRQGFDKRIILQFGLPSVLLSLLGAFLIGVLPQPVLKLILGIFLITTSTSFLIKPGFKIPANTGTFIAGGSATGFITALVGTGGALEGDSSSGVQHREDKIHSHCCNYSRGNRCYANTCLCIARLSDRSILSLFTCAIWNGVCRLFHRKKDSQDDKPRDI